VRAIADRSYDVLLEEIASVVASARDMTVFWQELIGFYRDMMIFKTTSAASKYLDLTDSEQEQLSALAAVFTKEQLLYHSKLLDEALFAMQRANVLKRSVAEMTLIRMCDETLDTSPEAILSRISKLEMAIAGGASVPTPTVTLKEEPKAENKTTVPEAPVQETPKATVVKKAAPPANDGRRVLKNLRAWVEIVDRMSELDVGAASFLRQARAYRDEATGKIIVRVDTEFSRMLIAQDAVQSNLYRTVGTVLGSPVPQGGIELEVKPKKADDGDLILDELEDI
jgi:DNA polymerase III gamma/tau subunit